MINLPKISNKSAPITDPTNKKFLDTVSKPVNKSVFSLLAYVQSKGIKAFNNLSKYTQGIPFLSKNTEITPNTKNKDLYYTLEEKTADENQQNSLKVLHTDLQEIQKNLESLISVSKENNKQKPSEESSKEDTKQKPSEESSKEDTKQKPSEESSKEDTKQKPSEEKPKDAVGVVAKRESFLQKSGKKISGIGKLIPGRIGKFLQKIGKKSQAYGRLIDKKTLPFINNISNEDVVTKNTTNNLLNTEENIQNQTTSSQEDNSSVINDIKDFKDSKLGKSVTNSKLFKSGKNKIGKFANAIIGKKGSNLLSRGASLFGKNTRLLNKFGGTASTKFGGKALSKIGGTALSKLGTKSLTKVAGKTLGKSLLKKIPGIGLIAGGLFGIGRLLKGDMTGALGEVASGAASTIPGVGTAVSAGIDTGLAAKDMIGGEEGEDVDTGVQQGLEQNSEPEAIPSYAQGLGNIQNNPINKIKSTKLNPLNILSGITKSPIAALSPLGMLPSLFGSNESKTAESPSGFTSILETPLSKSINSVSDTVGSMLGMDNPQSAKYGEMVSKTESSPIPVKIVSGEGSKEIMSEMKDGTMKQVDVGIGSGASPTFINNSSNISYSNDSSGQSPSIPHENIMMDDPYIMQATRGNFSMMP